MTTELNIWEKNRQNIYVDFFDKYTLEQLNKIPTGFSNNLIWNLGHIVVTQQLLIYKMSDVPVRVSETLIETYRKGTQPRTTTTQEEVNELKALWFSLVEQTKKDVAEGLFTSYNEYVTSAGFRLTSAQEAMQFVNYHEGLHLGMMMNIRKFV